MSDKKLSFYERLALAQNELHAPKGQKNTFGNYNYRSAEDIKEAVKPVNKKYDLHLITTDEIVLIGDRYYIKATAILTDVLDPENKIEVTGYAREALKKKGMDESQITGATASYAVKYALNGLYAIDDNKDADTNELREEREARARKEQEEQERQTKFVNQRNLLYNRTKDLAEKSGQNTNAVYSTMLNRVSNVTNKKESEMTATNVALYEIELSKAEETFEKNAKRRQEDEAEDAEQDGLFEDGTMTPKGQE